MAIRFSRPGLLTRAAKAGAKLYDRKRDLPKMAPRLAIGGRKSGLVKEILEAEALCEAERVAGAATYSVERHVSLLAALFAESGGPKTA